MQSWNECKECALGTCGEARVGIHCGTGPAPCPRPGCSALYWRIWVSQEHQLNMGTFNPERSAPQVPKAVEIFSAVPLTLKKLFNTLSMAYLDLGMYFLIKEYSAAFRQETNPGRFLRDQQMELTHWGAKEAAEWEKEQLRAHSHEYLVAVVPTPWWKWNVRSAQKCCESCLWHECLDAFEWWSPTWCNHFL